MGVKVARAGADIAPRRKAISEVLGFRQSELQILFGRLVVWEPQFGA